MIHYQNGNIWKRRSVEPYKEGWDEFRKKIFEYVEKGDIRTISLDNQFHQSKLTLRNIVEYFIPIYNNKKRLLRPPTSYVEWTGRMYLFVEDMLWSFKQGPLLSYIPLTTDRPRFKFILNRGMNFIEFVRFFLKGV